MTAVEYLVEQLEGRSIDEWDEFIEQAKQLEREQHARTWDAAIEAHEKRGNVKARSLSDFDEYEIK